MSALCTERVLTSARFVEWADRIRPAWDLDRSGRPVYTHRKLWEWLYIVAALEERDMLRPGRRGLGFGVGRDPLVALFASLGCEVTATDLDAAAAAHAGWVGTGQHASALAHLDEHGLCDPAAFSERVSFRTVDMNDVPADLTGFDFVWSACALEHLGSIVRGQAFVLDAMRCLRPGGVAVHTTEFNVSTNRTTLAFGPTVLFRRRDLEWLARRLRRAGHAIELDLDPGDTAADRHVDVAPFSNVHLKVLIGPYVATSLALVVEASASGSAARMPPVARRERRLAREQAVRRQLGAAARRVGLATRPPQPA